ncbi:MAG: penicillin-binding protein 1C [Rhodobacteraceae bacterium]|nr:penicillin-binding protein 1C [Paracoccaceae bacterium]
MPRLSKTLFALTLLLFFAAYSGDRVDEWIADTGLPPLAIETSVEVLDRNGALLRAYSVDDGRWRLAVTAPQVDPEFIRMLVAYEDKRFYRHTGVDVISMFRALGQAAWNRRVISGGSTLTMQVARLLEDGPTGRWQGKVRQIRVALALERHLTKQQILTLYLNRAPYGGNLEGIRAATRAYFGKEPRRLTPAEAALLVALPQSPTMRRPDRAPERARIARAAVLTRAEAAGVIDHSTAQAALRDPLPTTRTSLPALAPHLSDRAVATAPGLDRHDLTLDATLQEGLETLAARAAADYGARLSVAIVALDHENGDILASVGSAGYEGGARLGFVDMTRAVRSPGSTLKPLVYGLAFDEGLAHPETLIDDRPVRFGTYAPENFDGAYRGTLRVRDALTLSLNIPVVSLTEALGPARLMAALKRAGVTAHLPGDAPAGLAVALGGVGVTLEDMVALYASLASHGKAVTPHFRLTDGRANDTTVLSPEAAWQIGNILSEMPAPPNAPRNRLAYKTGTSYGHRDTWAIGFDGEHVIGVWMGRADGTPVPGAFGADLAAPILFEAFARLKPDLAPLGPPPPDTLLLSHAALPLPLREFHPRDALFNLEADAPVLAFPPDGAVIDTGGAPLVVKVESGTAPYTWLANGTPLLTGVTARQAELSLTGPGFFTLSVIDAEGRAARAQISLK